MFTIANDITYVNIPYTYKNKKCFTYDNFLDTYVFACAIHI